MGKGLGAAVLPAVRRAARATTIPPRPTGRRSATTKWLGQLTQVLSNRALNEVKVGYAYFILDQGNLTNWSNHWQRGNGITTGSPRIQFTGFNITPQPVPAALPESARLERA